MYIMSHLPPELNQYVNLFGGLMLAPVWVLVMILSLSGSALVVEVRSY